MLISHAKRFIYTKTVKTAGTSVESYFEPHCMRPGEWEYSHGRGEYVSEAGVVGVRTGEPIELQAATWWNHMPAATIRALAGPAVWDAYFKFCVVRNPFDQMVSAYRFFTKQEQPAAPVRRMFSVFGGRGSARGESHATAFEGWLKSVPLPLDRNKYVIDGVLCVDHVIRYERLVEGIGEVCQRLDVPFRPNELRHLKKSERMTVPPESYYTPAAVALVERGCAFELEQFGYTFPWAGARRAA